MKNLSICIDIDGTLTEPYYWLTMANSYFGKAVREQEVTVYPIHEVMGVTEEAYRQFYAESKFEIHRDPGLRTDASGVIDHLYRWHNIHFVTAREQELEMLTASYLRRYEIPHDSLHVTGSSNKVKHARTLQCDVFIEDSMDNAVLLAEAGYKVLLMDTTYNRSGEAAGNMFIQRVYDWQQIQEIIDCMWNRQQTVS